MIDYIKIVIIFVSNVNTILALHKLWALIEFYLLIFFCKIGRYFVDNSIGKTFRPKLVFLFLKTNLKFIFTKALGNPKFL